jgi:hypothetical protein
MTSETSAVPAGTARAPIEREMERSARTASRRFELLVLVLFTALISVVSAFHEPWKDETQAWRLAIDSGGLRELAYNARYEGHPLLWHVLLQLVGYLSRSWWAAAVLHVVIACVGAWLVLRYAPFTRLQKVLLVFGYYSAYEYAVVVRPYGLGMMLAFAACIAWTAPRRRIGWSAVCLVLLANTTFIGTLLAMTMALAFAIDWAWPDDAERRPSKRALIVAGSAAFLATVLVLAITVAQVKPPTDAAYVGEAKSVTSISQWDLASIPTRELNVLTPLARSDGGLMWSRWLFLPRSKPALAVVLAASLIAIAVGILIAARRRVALVCYVVGTAGYLLFFAFFFPGTLHHHGYLFVVWVVSAWLAWASAPSERPSMLASISRRLDGWRAPLFTASLVIPTLATLQMWVADLRMPFADARHVAEVIRSNGLDRAPIVTILRSDGQAVAAFLDREVIFPLEGTSRTFVVWGRGSPYRATARAADSAVTALLARECRVVVISSPERDVAATTAARARSIYTTPEPPLSADRYRLWVASSPDTARCPAGRYPSGPSRSVPHSNPTS